MRWRSPRPFQRVLLPFQRVKINGFRIQLRHAPARDLRWLEGGCVVMMIFLFTQSYPYDTASEQMFIGPEIGHLAEYFEKVILLPRSPGNKADRLPLPASVVVDEKYSDFLQNNLRPYRTSRRTLQSILRELRRQPSILPYPSKLLKLVLFSARAELTRKWMTMIIKTQSIDPTGCILYSYWFDHAATGLAMVKRKFPDLRVVSRAHGYDIYEKYYYPYYWPRRRETLAALDALFVASDAGRRYFVGRYPEYESKFETAHLGINDPGLISPASQDGVFRIVSCSYIVPVKRLGLLADGIAAAARLRPGQKFEWTHFGDGSEKKSLQPRMARNFPANVKHSFPGWVPNAEIRHYYGTHPCDVFVNASETEGGVPLSIQEAMSCGIPVIATAVGGNPEIVSGRNGILLSANPIAAEIAEALLRLWDDPVSSGRMRQESRRVWKEGYDADVNFRSFAERLTSIGKK